MPTPIPAGLKLGLVEPSDAIAAFQRRQLLQPSYAWQDVWQDEHTRAFAVAGVMRLDVLKLFQDELAAALQAGTSLKQFQEAVMPQLTAKGFWGDVEVSDPATGETRVTTFDKRRLELIYQVNMRQSAAAGRWKRIEANKARQPFVMYRTMRDEQVRLTHRPWDSLVLPVDDPWWETHFPPCGWRCRCTAFGLSQRDIDRRRRDGEAIKTQRPPEQWIPYVNPRTGELTPVPRGVDPGFAHNAGKDRDAELFDASLRKALGTDPAAAATVLAQAQADHPGFLGSAARRFGRFVDQLAPEGQAPAQARGELRFVGAMGPAAVRAAERAGVGLASPVVAVRDQDALATLAASSPAEGAAVPRSVYRRLPELLQRAQALLLDVSTTPATLLYVVDLVTAEGTEAKLVARLEAGARPAAGAAGPRLPMTLVRTVAVMSPQELQDRTRYYLLWGTL